MNYTVQISKKAQKFIKAQQPKQQKRILDAIHKLPHEGDIKALEGKAKAYRLRVGDYRIIYQVDNGAFIIIVVDADNRGQIYKNKRR